MRTMRFIVEGRQIRLEPRNNLADNNTSLEDYTRAEFSFSKEWLNSPKVVAFYSRLGAEYPPQALKDGQSCLIPLEALEKRFFKVQVLGRNGLKTNKLEIDRKGGCV